MMNRGSNEFWKNFLDGSTEKIDLFNSNKRNIQNILPLAANKYYFEIESSTIQLISNAQQVNLSTYLLSLFFASLFQCTGKEDLVICALLGRNILPLRLRMDEIHTLDELFESVAKVISTCSLHQDVSFEDIVKYQTQMNSVGQLLFIFTSELEQPSALQTGNSILM